MVFALFVWAKLVDKLPIPAPWKKWNGLSRLQVMIIVDGEIQPALPFGNPSWLNATYPVNCFVIFRYTHTECVY